MEPQSTKLLQLRFVKGYVQWEKTIEVASDYLVTMPFPMNNVVYENGLSKSVTVWMEWLSINGINEQYHYKPEFLVEISTIEDK